MRTKRLTAAAAGLAGLVLATAACSGSSGTSAAANPSGGAAKPQDVVYVQGVTGNPFFTSVTCGAQEQAKAEGFTFSFQGGADYSPQAQTPVLNAVVAKKPAGIVISPMAGDAMVPPLRQAKSAGIKLVFVDSTAADESLAASFVTSDNVEGGKLAAQKLAELVGDKGKVMVLGATPGISTTDARQKGFEDEIKANHPNITLLPTQFSQSTPAGATSKLTATIAANKDLAGVFAVSTQEVEGASVAVKSAKAAGKIKLVGFDTSDPILEDIKTDVVQGLVVQEPLEMGKQAIQQMAAALKGQSTTPLIHTPFVFLTKDNLNDPAVNQYIYKTSC